MRPVVLVHGLLGHLNDPRIMSAIADRNTFAPDLLGYGAYRDCPTDGLTLMEQADHVAGFIRDINLEPVNLVGHSVGGAVSVLLAANYPDLVATLTFVEGNFTLKDAFWSAQVAQQDITFVETTLAGYKADPNGWISGAGVEINDWTHTLARDWLNNQPATTIKAQAHAVVEATGKPEYLELVRKLMASDMPYHLLAGENSRQGWDVPDWAANAATSNQDIPGTGHLMMAEKPEAFGAVIRGNCV
ncbi:alpha/beta fold hydrolase [Kiloniella sp.]|uniref:alpha/beta fold hydrolase n=1 Tax=Kiloniella sp. TaxID=1938587 RepID=UPI003B0164CF